MANKVLESALGCPQPFSKADLVVKVWKNYPADFSLEGYHYPDSNKIISAIVGKRGLVAKGKLEKVGPNLYKLPDDLDKLAKIDERLLSPIEKLKLRKAWKLWKENRTHELTAWHALQFWGFPSSLLERGKSMEKVSEILLKAGDEEPEIRSLRNLNDWLIQKFAK